MPPGSYDAVPGGALLRYAGDQIDDVSGQPLGVFQLVSWTDDAALSPEERREFRALRRWFSDHLALPRRFSHHRDGWRRSSAGMWVRTPIAISWFKPDAIVHLARIRRMCELMAIAKVFTRELTTTKPGYVTYEDRHQVVAVPFSARRDGCDEEPGSHGQD